MGRSQPGVGLWSPHFFVLHFFESGLTLNPHNKRHSFGLFISLYLCCVVDCINVCVIISRSVTQEVKGDHWKSELLASSVFFSQQL